MRINDPCRGRFHSVLPMTHRRTTRQHRRVSECIGVCIAVRRLSLVRLRESLCAIATRDKSAIRLIDHWNERLYICSGCRSPPTRDLPYEHRHLCGRPEYERETRSDGTALGGAFATAGGCAVAQVAWCCACRAYSCRT